MEFVMKCGENVWYYAPITGCNERLFTEPKPTASLLLYDYIHLLIREEINWIKSKLETILPKWQNVTQNKNVDSITLSKIR
jgi:hypothetical protein